MVLGVFLLFLLLHVFGFSGYSVVYCRLFFFLQDFAEGFLGSVLFHGVDKQLWQGTEWKNNILAGAPGGKNACKRL